MEINCRACFFLFPVVNLSLFTIKINLGNTTPLSIKPDPEFFFQLLYCDATLLAVGRLPGNREKCQDSIMVRTNLDVFTDHFYYCW